MMIIAHRGASAVAPESTAAALREAVRAGVSFIEVDVQMTPDGRLVVFHDEQLDRTTDGHGRLNRTLYARLRPLDAGSWFHPRFAGERVLLLSQALRLVPARVGFNLELKRTRRGPALIAALARVLQACGAASRVLISSFDPHLLRLAQRYRWPRALICRRFPQRSLALARRLGCVAWHPRTTLVTAARVAQAHAAGLRVQTWTVDDVATAARLQRWGVDGLFTNDPARLMAWQRRSYAR